MVNKNNMCTLSGDDAVREAPSMNTAFKKDLLWTDARLTVLHCFMVNLFVVLVLLMSVINSTIICQCVCPI